MAHMEPPDLIKPDALEQRYLQRRLILVSGDAQAARRALIAQLQQLAHPGMLWIGDGPADGVPELPVAKARQLLGQELDLLVFDAHEGFDQDAFAAVSGAVRGGGLLILLTPGLDAWPQQADAACERFATHPYGLSDIGNRFLRRLLRLIEADAALLHGSADRLDLAGLLQTPAVSGCIELTADQVECVAALMHVASGHRRRPLVITADRGRGKSAAMGVAAARLLAGGAREILVTAPSQAALSALFTHAEAELPGAAERIRYLAPDELLRNPQAAGLLLVDEAAAIPTPLLEQLLQRYARIAFATTVHGYEGNGRGFAVRFRNTLDQRTPQWRELRLSQPVRWAVHDPVEAFVFRALLLDADAAPAEALQGLSPEACVIERLDRDRLVEDEPLLGQLFGLLVLAHYQTRPADLRQLLDAPGVAVWVMRYQGQVVATAVVAEEGDLGPELAEAVWAGKRRPRGHLVPQTLAAHAGLRSAAGLRYARVMRIAVHPVAQRQGLGSRLLAQVAELAHDEGRDLLAVSYGLSTELLAFWRRAGFRSARLGVAREAASGSHSLVMLRPLSDAGHVLAAEAKVAFGDTLQHGLSDHFSVLEPELVCALIQDIEAGPLPGEPDLAQLGVFVDGGRDYAGALPALYRLLWSTAARPALWSSLSEVEQSALLMRVLQQRPWVEVARALGLPGRRQVMDCLREAVARLLSGVSNPHA